MSSAITLRSRGMVENAEILVARWLGNVSEVSRSG
jgi:hypothetical protein